MILHGIIQNELLEQKSLAALVWLINNGRELEFTADGTLFFISRDSAQKQVSLWEGKQEQLYEYQTQGALQQQRALNDFIWGHPSRPCKFGYSESSTA